MFALLQVADFNISMVMCIPNKNEQRVGKISVNITFRDVGTGDIKKYYF